MTNKCGRETAKIQKADNDAKMCWHQRLTQEKVRTKRLWPEKSCNLTVLAWLHQSNVP